MPFDASEREKEIPNLMCMSGLKQISKERQAPWNKALMLELVFSSWLIPVLYSSKVEILCNCT